MAEVRLDGPFGASPSDTESSVDTSPKFVLGSRLVTTERYSDAGNDVVRIYRYCRTRQALTTKLVYKISSAWEVHDSITTTNAALDTPVLLGVNVGAVTSPTGSVYKWIQTGGLFSYLPVLTACSPSDALYTSATAGYLDDDGSAVGFLVEGVKNVGAKTAGTGTCIGFSPVEMYIRNDVPKNEHSFT